MKIQDFKRMKQEQKKIAMLTCYDYPSACIIAESNIDCVLVGDSVAMTIHGHDSTIMASIDMMELHTKAVARGLSHQFLVTDLPFLTHKYPQAQLVDDVKRLLQAGAQAIKIEGADKDTCHTIAFLVQAGIPVIGHIGLTPQFIHQLGGYKIQGRTQEQADRLLQQALSLEGSGCSALVIECVPQDVAQIITEALTIPTIGIGAGPKTDGQVLVWHDMLGLQTSFNLKFVKKYAHATELFVDAINQYVNEVQHTEFPTPEHAF